MSSAEHIHNRFTALRILSGRNIHPLTPFVVISHPLTAFSIYYDPWHPPCSIYMPDNLFSQSLSKFSLVYLLAWHRPLHTPYISSPNHCLLFAAHECFFWYRLTRVVPDKIDRAVKLLCVCVCVCVVARGFREK